MRHFVQNESPLAYYFHCAVYCLNLNASAAVKVSAIQNVDNVARKVENILKTKSNLHYTRGITPKRVTSGGAHLRDLAPGLHSSEETSQRWRAVGDSVSI